MADTTLSPVDAARIAEGLSKIRRRRLLAHGGTLFLLVSVPLIMGFGKICGQCGGVLRLVGEPAIWFGLLWFAGGIFVPVAGMHCPRCGKEFHMGPRYRNDFARRCLHCGLRLKG
jgi:hypothetical protein